MTYTEAYAKCDGRPLRDAFFCATDRGDLEWDDSGVTEAKVPVYMAAEGVPLRNAFLSTAYRGDLKWDD